MKVTFRKLKEFAIRHIDAIKCAWNIHGITDMVFSFPPLRDNFNFFYSHNTRDTINALSQDFVNINFTLLFLVLETAGNVALPAYPSQHEIIAMATASPSISAEETEESMKRVIRPYIEWLDAVTTRINLEVFTRKWVDDLVRGSPNLTEVHAVHIGKALSKALGSKTRSKWNKKMALSSSVLEKLKRDLDDLVAPTGEDSLLKATPRDPQTTAFVKTTVGTLQDIQKVGRDLDEITNGLTTRIRDKRVVISKDIQWSIYHLEAPARRQAERRAREEREADLKQKWDAIDEQYHLYYTLYSTALPALSNTLLCLGPSLISEYTHVKDGSNFGVYIGVTVLLRILRYFCHKYDKAPFAALCGMIVCENIVQVVLILVAALKP